MKIWKIISMTICMVCMSVLAWAATPYVDPGYDLSQVTEIRVTSIEDTMNEPWNNFTHIDGAEDEVMQALYTVGGKKKKKIQDDRNAPAYSYDQARMTVPHAVELRVSIQLYGTTKSRVEGHYEEYTQYMDYEYIDEKGRKQTLRRPEKRQRWVDPYDAYYSYMKIKYDVYDIHTGKLIASIVEERDRSDNSVASMLKRGTDEMMSKIFKRR